MTVTYVVFAALGFIVGPLTLWLALSNILQGIWHAGAIFALKRRLTSLVSIVLSLILCVPMWLVTGIDDVRAYFALIVLLLPFPIYWTVSRLAWFRDSELTRMSASAIREELAERYSETPPPKGRWWAGYVYDVERMKRRAAYEPPPV